MCLRRVIQNYSVWYIILSTIRQKKNTVVLLENKILHWASKRLIANVRVKNTQNTAVSNIKKCNIKNTLSYNLPMDKLPTARLHRIVNGENTIL